MATPVNLPELGESVTEGTVTRWLKQVGDTVEVDEPLLEVSTDKVDTEIPSPVAGVLLEIKAEEDDTVEVGGALAIIGDADEDSSSSDEQSGGGEATGASGTQESQPTEEPESSPEPEPAPEPESSPEPAPQASSGGGSAEGTSVTLPELGESVTEGTVTRWLKQVGDSVEVDEPLLEVSTDKVDTEIPSPVAGTLLEIKVDEDETVAVGAELAVVGSGEPASGGTSEPEPTPEPEAAPEPEPEPTPEPEPEPAPEPAQESDAEHHESTSDAPAPNARSERPGSAETPSGSGGSQTPSGSSGSYVTPIVRKLAGQHGVDLESLTGTGVGGRIRKQDVLDAAKAQDEAKAAPAAQESAPAAESKAPASSVEPSPLRGKTEKMSRLRKVIATRMVESLQVSAQLTTVVEIDVTRVARLRAKHKEAFAAREGVKLSFLPFFAKAAVDTLKQYPQVNSTIDMDEGTVTYHGAENLGMAVDTERGLLVPVIKDAGDLSIAGLARKIADVAERTRDNKISPDDLSGGTFTLTNTGSRGALFDTPIINQPQVAILGTGSVVKRPVVIDDANLGETIAVRQMVYFALTYDHRIVDGADAARFLSAIKQRLEEANFEAELG
ncbi:MAG: 2-oxoglutarate dehydrogenase, E2 component, dihydrolipoamide succinyltransferase [Nocardioidaceae bacterium]|nr:2-oxoglutarate dehydrogenase, E2 component, dihydrolipoamide succinyltransferase [Nocardioidaceae bacterium]